MSDLPMGNTLTRLTETLTKSVINHEKLSFNHHKSQESYKYFLGVLCVGLIVKVFEKKNLI